MTPLRVRADEARQHGHHAVLERGAAASRARAPSVSSMSGRGAAEGLVGDDHARARPPPRAAMPRASQAPRPRSRTTAARPCRRWRPGSAAVSSPEVVDAGVEGAQLGDAWRRRARGGGRARARAGTSSRIDVAVALAGSRTTTASQPGSRARARLGAADQQVGDARRARRPPRPGAGPAARGTRSASAADPLGGAHGGPAELHDDHGSRPRAWSSSAFRMAAPAAPRIVLWTSASSLQVEERVLAHAAHGDRHPALAVAVEPRLRPVGLVQHVDGPLGARWAARAPAARPGTSASAARRLRGGGLLRRLHEDGHGVAVGHGHAVHGGGDRGSGACGRRRRRSVPRISQRLGLDLLLLAAADVGDHVVRDVQGGDAGVAGAGEGLQRDHGHALEAERAVQRGQGHGQADHAAVRVGDDVAAARALALHGQRVEVVGVDLGDEQRHVGVHAVVARVGDHGVALARRAPSPPRRPPRSRGPRRGASSGTCSSQFVTVSVGHARAGSGVASRQVHASRYGLPAERSEAATSATSNQGWSARSWMKRWPTAPVAPSTPTGIFVMSVIVSAGTRARRCGSPRRRVESA